MYDSGYHFLEESISGYLKEAERPEEILKVGADALVEDVRSLPKPRSNRKVPTHLLDTVQDKIDGSTVKVGWGLNYGWYVEHQIKNPPENAHLGPAWERGKDRYTRLMIDAFHKQRR